jgi:hypothetical protein
MENNIVSFTVKVPVAVHRKLKLMSLVYEKSMTELLINWVTDAKVELPDDLLLIPVKTAKPVKAVRQKFAKTVNTGKPKAGKPDPVAIRKELLKYYSEDPSFQVITDKLIANKVSTFSGRGIWDRGTVAKQIKKVLAEAE